MRGSEHEVCENRCKPGGGRSAGHCAAQQSILTTDPKGSPLILDFWFSRESVVSPLAVSTQGLSGEGGGCGVGRDRMRQLRRPRIRSSGTDERVFNMRMLRPSAHAPGVAWCNLL